MTNDGCTNLTSLCNVVILLYVNLDRVYNVTFLASHLSRVIKKIVGNYCLTIVINFIFFSGFTGKKKPHSAETTSVENRELFLLGEQKTTIRRTVYIRSVIYVYYTIICIYGS